MKKVFCKGCNIKHAHYVYVCEWKDVFIGLIVLLGFIFAVLGWMNFFFPIGGKYASSSH